MRDLARRLAEHWKQKRFPSDGRPMLLALSGGLDSMVLAHLLTAVKIPFAAAHVNFRLRGADADGDSLAVRDWCASNGIPFHSTDFDTKTIAAAQKKSIQVTARDLRYEWFESLRKAHGYAAILTAHHADDVAETMLINLSRGSGIAGLHGIPERTGAVLRPMLFATRADILAYANTEDINWREDASNAADAYLRNAIRHHILPKLDKLMPGAALRMAETAERLRGTETIYRKALERRLSKLKQQRGKDWYVPIRLLEKEEALQAVAYELFSRFGFSADQIPQILGLSTGESGRQVLSSAHRVIRHRDFLVITSLTEVEADLVQIETIPALVETAEGSFHFSWVNADTQISDDPNVALLQGDGLVFPLSLRTRREGDYFYPLGMGGKKKKLKRFLIDIKTPLHEKDRIRILESDKKILWVVGKRIDERFRMRGADGPVLQVVFEARS